MRKTAWSTGGFIVFLFIYENCFALTASGVLTPANDPVNFPLTGGKPYCKSMNIREVYSQMGEKISSTPYISSEFEFYISPALRRKVEQLNLDDGHPNVTREFIYNISGYEILNSFIQGQMNGFGSSITETGYADLSHPADATYQRSYSQGIGPFNSQIYNIESEGYVEYIYEPNGNRPIQRITSRRTADGDLLKDTMTFTYDDSHRLTHYYPCRYEGGDGVFQIDKAGRTILSECRKGDIMLGHYVYEYFSNGSTKSQLQEEYDESGKQIYFYSTLYADDTGENSIWFDDWTRESRTITKKSEQEDIRVDHTYERDSKGRVIIHRYQVIDLKTQKPKGPEHEVHRIYSGDRLTEISDRGDLKDGQYAIYRTTIDYSCLEKN